MRKIKIIEKAERLVDLENINTSIRELNNLHRLWKSELGPVARDKRRVMEKISNSTKKYISEKTNTLKILIQLN